MLLLKAEYKVSRRIWVLTNQSHFTTLVLKQTTKVIYKHSGGHT